DQYKTLEEIKKTFISFANKVPFYCPVILCLDDANLQSLIPNLERRVITYGFSAQADIYAQNPSFAEFSSSSTVFWQGKKLGTLRLNVPGLHSIYNAMAAIAVGLDLDIPSQTILKGLAKFKGIGRRFELKAQIGKKYIFEDYAHHPTEIKATLEAAKLGWGRRILAVFQPHRYTRLALLMDQFSTCFNQADTLIITEIYPAGEKPIPGISGRKLFEAIQTYGHKDVYFEPEMAQIPDLVQRLAQPEDLIFVLGAGSIYRIIPEIIKKLGGKN
ncbi:MAG TPA: UDP-N-acetylmuramate--L-alanine ligase, partial [Candidatus Aminicenantes bacterium]|nr:UDP-N-acetylmuramate--L-alanine ligase [Candidatus Aminicenantes bacterium]